MGNDAHGTALAVPFDSTLTIPDNASYHLQMHSEVVRSINMVLLLFKNKRQGSDNQNMAK